MNTSAPAYAPAVANWRSVSALEWAVSAVRAYGPLGVSEAALYQRAAEGGCDPAGWLEILSYLGASKQVAFRAGRIVPLSWRGVP